jgi:hypothetical protein
MSMLCDIRETSRRAAHLAINSGGLAYAYPAWRCSDVQYLNFVKWARKRRFITHAMFSG